jgi:hypothetical protein
MLNILHGHYILLHNRQYYACILHYIEDHTLYIYLQHEKTPSYTCSFSAQMFSVQMFIEVEQNQ